MRALFLFPPVAAVLAAQVQMVETLPLAVAESRYLDAWDLRDGKPPVPVPAVARQDRPALQWLVSASAQALPANPFPRGGAPWKEAEAVRRFLQAPPERWVKDLESLPVTLGGSYLALWRWGQPKVRTGRIAPELRRRWEDKLLEGRGPGLVRDFALRHSLCFALAEADGGRFAQLKEGHEAGIEGLFPKFQSAFALLGAPAPVVQLWKLPGMESVSLPLGQLGGTQVRFVPDPGKGLPELPPGTVWIVPTLEGSQPEATSYLVGASLKEARQLIPRLEAAQRTAYLAPTRKTFEAYALMYFPIQVDLDERGWVRSIRMGDAALAKQP